jgi:hypothetical protein
MVLPPAYQVTGDGMGADTGGVNPLFVALVPALEFDSWLTIGVVDGSIPVASTAVDFASWGPDPLDGGLTISNGAVMLYGNSAAVAPNANNPEITVAQITMPSGTTATATMNLQGHTEDRSSTVSLNDQTADWQELGVVFTMSNDVVPAVPCVDVDDCASSPCEHGAFCTDAYLSYVCSCETGYTGDNCGLCDNGWQIRETDRLDTGWVDGETNYCEHVDNCDAEEDDCDENAVCSHTGPGEHYCECTAGYHGNGQSCADFDACSMDLGEYASVMEHLFANGGVLAAREEHPCSGERDASGNPIWSLEDPYVPCHDEPAPSLEFRCAIDSVVRGLPSPFGATYGVAGEPCPYGYFSTTDSSTAGQK